ncbi:hypothetical protein ScPMuIL_013645 [Solemya velum]
MIGEIEASSKDEEPGNIAKKEVTGEDKSEKDDSADSEESDDDIVVRNPKKKSLRIEDDDLDSDASHHSTPDSVSEASGHSKVLKTAEEALAAVLNAESESDSDAQFDVSTDNDSDENDKILTVIRRKKKKATPTTQDSTFSAILDEDDASSQDKQTSALKLETNDLFDADQSDSGDSGEDGDKDAERGSGSGEDEGFDDSEISPELLKKLKRGAGKKEKKPRTGSSRKSKEEAKLQIHSESQRILRESRVNLPYHQPSPKPLKDFLARANKKQEEYKALRGTNSFKKAQALEDLLVKTRMRPCLSDPLTANAIAETLDNKSISATNNKSELFKEPTKENVDYPKIPQTKISDFDMDEDSLPDLSGIMETKGMSDYTETDMIHCDGGICDEEGSQSVNEDRSSQHMSSNSVEPSDSNDYLATCSKTICDSFSTQTVVPSGNIPTDIDSSLPANNDAKRSGISLEPCRTAKEENEPRDDPDGCLRDSKNTDTNEGQSVTPRVPHLSGVDLAFKPSLSGGPLSMVDLEGGTATPQNPGLTKLMTRLMNHSQKKKKEAKDVDISIICKEKSSTGSDELKMGKFTYHTDDADDNSLMKLEQPGAKLVYLKEKLQSEMKMKREVARQKRQEIFDLDNEEGGYLGEDKAEEEEEEAEMTDESETDVEDEEFDEEFDEDDVDKERVDNPFMDDEAEEEEEEEAADENEEGEMNLKLDVSDEEEEDTVDTDDVVKDPLKKKKSRTLTFSDDEESKSKLGEASEADPDTGGQVVFLLGNSYFWNYLLEGLVIMVELCPAGLSNLKGCWTDDPYSVWKTIGRAAGVEVRNFKQIGEDLGEKQDDKDSEVMSPFTKHISTVTPTQAVRRTSSLSLPIEDSEDLYGNTVRTSHFFMDDSQSQMLDADGFLKVQSVSKTLRRPSDLPPEPTNTQENMDELLGLCTGKFIEPVAVDDKKSSCKNLFGSSHTVQATQGMDELLGLCSGVFVESSKTNPSDMTGVKSSLRNDEDEEDSSLRLLSDNEDNSNHEEDGFSDGSDNSNHGDEVDGDDLGDDNAKSKNTIFSGFTAQKKHGRIRREFVDEEAELSGSEYDSDENLDLAEEEDIMEEELGDKDVVASEEELRNQVGRVHLKQMIDDDARQLVRFQEMYLPDGDLHTEGGGRQRNFKWRNMDDDTQQDMFDNDSDGEHRPEEDAEEIKWRMERYEREKWLEDQQENAEDASNSILKLGKVFLKKKGSIDCSSKKDEKQTEMAAPGTPNSLFKQGKNKKGSFLSRSKASLAKIAERTKGGTANPGGPRNSRNFVFQVLSPEKKDQKDDCEVCSQTD